VNSIDLPGKRTGIIRLTYHTARFTLDGHCERGQLYFMCTTPNVAKATIETEEEIEITPEMIEAGYRVLCNSGIADVYLKADKILVAEIFETMFALRPQVSGRPT
jgi:hypothetical protein